MFTPLAYTPSMPIDAVGWVVLLVGLASAVAWTAYLYR